MCKKGVNIAEELRRELEAIYPNRTEELEKLIDGLEALGPSRMEAFQEFLHKKIQYLVRNSEFSSEEHFIRYVKKSFKNFIYEIWREFLKQPVYIDMGSLAPIVATPSKTPVQIAIQSETLDIISRAINVLPRQEQIVMKVALYDYIEQIMKKNIPPFPKIAKDLGQSMSRQQARELYNKAKERLKKTLKHLVDENEEPK